MKIESLLIAETPIIWILTHEYERAIERLKEISKEMDKTVRVWSVTKGIEGFDDEETASPTFPLEYAVEKSTNMEIIALLDYHRFLDNPAVFRKLLDSIEEIKKNQSYNQFAIISPVLEIPPEIEKYITVVELELPTQEELERVLENMFKSFQGLLDPEFEKNWNPHLRKKLAKAGKGLTMNEFISAINISVASKNCFDIKEIFEQKKQLIKKTSGLEIVDPEEIDEVKGLERAKNYIKKAVESGIGRGALLVGPPGTGKSLLAKQVGKLTNLPTIMLDFGAIFGSLVGESERKIAHALKTVEAMAPCILFIDELEKGLSGINSSDQTDGGTGSRVFGKFLTWLNDKNSGVYVIATANDISKLPPEFLRAGRWNWIFFVDLPNEEEREEMLKYYCKKYQIEYQPVDTSGFTGAEIKALVENAKILDCSLEEAKEAVIPISRTRGEEIKRMREYGLKNFIPASESKKERKTRKLSLV